MLLSGEDSNAFEFTLLGGDGVISVTSNVVPELQVRLSIGGLMRVRGGGGCRLATGHHLSPPPLLYDKATLVCSSNPPALPAIFLGPHFRGGIGW